MRRVFTGSTPAEAHFLVALLRARGIAAEVENEALWDTEEVGPSGWPAVIVPVDGAAAAAAFVEDFVARRRARRAGRDSGSALP